MFSKAKINICGSGNSTDPKCLGTDPDTFYFKNKMKKKKCFPDS